MPKISFNNVLVVVMVLVTANFIRLGVDAKSKAELDMDSSIRIVGGELTKPGEFPFLVGISYKNKHHCAGSILDEQHILTAAHCLDVDGDLSLSELDIRVGCHGRFSCSNISIAAYTIHENFTEDTAENDIALIKTLEPIQLNEVKGLGAIKGIKLPENNDKIYDDKERLLVVGWGWTLCQFEAPSNVPLKVMVSTMSLKRCIQELAYVGNSLDERNICAGSLEKGANKGDSGGPLIEITNESDGSLQEVVVGIVSWAPPECDRRLTAVYTRVSAFLDWIQATKNTMAHQ